ncbi:ABC transporter substrate-binding protein [Marinobacter sp. JSM 1782161]|uniref:ABC transporter substrate-binding protein n=1 Tax=Marinobacter sp. JSM 1782161 TaxID=2685906 RepID=UPI001A9D1B2F|nr:ABC transporter substrate-binding protein [Marinobacter sp. JSM 1782161]
MSGRFATDRPFWRCLLGMIGLCLLAGCSPNQDPDQLTLGGPFEFTSQDPSRDGYVYTRMQVAETLLDVDDQGNFLPGLATDWHASDDGLTWTLTLRDGVRFHDGTPMDAAAVVNALRMARLKPGVIAKAPIEGIEEAGPRTVTVTLARPYALLPAVLAHFSAAILSPASFHGEGQVDWMYGTGPYQIRSFEPPHSLVVERFDDYWGEPAHIESAAYLTGHRAESRALQVMAGQTDIIYTLDPASLDLLTRHEDVAVHSDTIPRTIQIKLNASHPFMAERDARQAMSLALDRASLVRQVMRVPDSQANQLAPPAMADWHRDDLPELAHDPEQARQLLTRLGWTPGDDGILQRDGERFELEMITYADRPELMVIATVVQAQWRDVGIDLSVQVVNASAIPRKHLDGTLETAVVARNYGNMADPLGVFLADYGDGGSGEWGAMGWHNDDVPALLKAMQATTDPAVYRRDAQQVSAILAAEMPVIPLAYYTQQTAVSDRVLDFSFDPYERNYRLSEMRFQEQ